MSLVVTMKFSTLLQYSWLDTAEGRTCLDALFRRAGPQKRARLGLLEAPSLPQQMRASQVAYKLFFCGKTGCGKTHTIANLVGNGNSDSYSETLGIQSSVIFWPVRVRQNKATVLVRLDFWETGEASMNKFDHVLPSCLEQVDVVVLMFSAANQASWDDLPKLIAKLELPDSVLKLAIGTHFSERPDIEPVVTDDMISTFREVWKMPVLKISNVVDHPQSRKPGTDEKAASGKLSIGKTHVMLLNQLCELLWYRDQVNGGLVAADAVDYCFTERKVELTEQRHKQQEEKPSKSRNSNEGERKPRSGRTSAGLKPKMEENMKVTFC